MNSSSLNMVINNQENNNIYYHISAFFLLLSPLCLLTMPRAFISIIVVLFGIFSTLFLVIKYIKINNHKNFLKFIDYNSEDTLWIIATISIFLIALLSNIYHHGSIKNIDNPSRFILIIPIIFYLRKYWLNLNFFTLGAILGVIITFIITIYQFFILNIDRVHGFVDPISFGNLVICLGVMSLNFLFIHNDTSNNKYNQYSQYNQNSSDQFDHDQQNNAKYNQELNNINNTNTNHNFTCNIHHLKYSKLSYFNIFNRLFSCIYQINQSNTIISILVIITFFLSFLIAFMSGSRSSFTPLIILLPYILYNIIKYKLHINLGIRFLFYFYLLMVFLSIIFITLVIKLNNFELQNEQTYNNNNTNENNPITITYKENINKYTFRILDAYHDIVAYKNGQVDTSIGARIDMWRGAFYIGLNNFWTGCGPDNYLAQLQDLVNRKIVDKSVLKYNQPHNEYLKMFAMFGIFGVIAFLFLFLFPVYLLLINNYKNKISTKHDLSSHNQLINNQTINNQNQLPTNKYDYIDYKLFIYSFSILFLVFSLTESVINRQNNASFAIYCLSIIWVLTNNIKNRNKYSNSKCK